MTAPAIPPHSVRIGVLLEYGVDGRLINRPARPPAYGVTLNVLQGAREEALQHLTGRVYRKNHQRIADFVPKKPAFRSEAFQMRIWSNQGRSGLCIVLLGTHRDAL